jgi:serine/threonine-protein kinase
MKCLEKHQSFRYKNIEEMLNKLNVLAGYTPITKEEKEEFLDSPTIVIPKINDGMMKKDDEKKIIELNLIDEKSDKAFKTFFGEDNIDDSIGKQNPKKKSEMNKKLDEEKRRNRKITAAAIICALAVAMLGGFIGLKAMLYVPEVKVPDLIGKNEDAAKKIVEDLGLVFKVSEREYSSKYDDGEVIEQSVEKDTKLKKGYPVDVVVSKGIQDIKVPNLVGKFAIEAGIILSDYGLKEGTVTEEFSDTVPAGQIISQNPAKNTPADVGDKVDYAVSKGSEKSTVVMPNLVGLQLDTAKKLIEENGLAVGQVTEEKSEKAAGIVTKQSVPAGQDVAAGSAIWMTISSGSEEPEQKPETGTGEIKPTDGTYPLTITLPKDKDKVLVVVQRVIDDKREIIYSKEVETSQQNITVNIQGEGYQTFEIYIDNKLYDRAEINF